MRTIFRALKAPNYAIHPEVVNEFLYPNSSGASCIHGADTLLTKSLEQFEKRAKLDLIDWFIRDGKFIEKLNEAAEFVSDYTDRFKTRMVFGNSLAAFLKDVSCNPEKLKTG